MTLNSYMTESPVTKKDNYEFLKIAEKVKVYSHKLDKIKFNSSVVLISRTLINRNGGDRSDSSNSDDGNDDNKTNIN